MVLDDIVWYWMVLNGVKQYQMVYQNRKRKRRREWPLNELPMSRTTESSPNQLCLLAT